MINQPPNTAFLELAPVPPWNMKTCHAEVRSTGGSLRVFGQFAWLEVSSAKMALSRAARQRATQAVGWLWQDWNLVYFYLDKKGVMQQELAENIGMSVWLLHILKLAHAGPNPAL